MFDRSVQFPQRYQLQKVAGTDDIYDIIPAPGEIQNEGTLINKSTLLTDAVASMFGFGASAVPNDMFNVLTHAGDLHVWKRTIDGVTDYPVHPNRNAYQEGSDEQPAGYTLGEVVSQNTTLTQGTNQSNYTVYFYRDTIEVSNDGTIDLSQFTSELSIVASTNGANTGNSNLKGKFIVKKSKGNSLDNFPINTVYFIPSDATFSFHAYDGSAGSAYVYVNKYQPVIGYAAIPAGTTIEYMGQLGNKARIETGSYVGTGTFNVDNPTSIQLPFEAKILIISAEDEYTTPNSAFIIMAFSLDEYKPTGITLATGALSSNLNCKQSANTVYWYASTNSANQMNTQGKQYSYCALG